MSRDLTLYIEDIYFASVKIKEYSLNITFFDFIQDSMRFDAIVRNIEIIGEAAKYLSDEFKQATPSIPWREIIAMRNILIHAYFGIDPDIVWDVVANKIEILLEELKPYLHK